MKRKGRRGVTLVELTIVILLVAIVALMVVSLSTVISRIVDNHAYTRKAMGEITLLQTTTSDWVSYYDSSDYRFSSESNAIFATDANGCRYSISFRDGRFVAQYPDHNVVLEFETVTRADYSLARTGEDGSALVRCVTGYHQVAPDIGGNKTAKTLYFCFARRSATIE